MEFESRFKIFRSEKTVRSFNIFSSPFNIDVETVPDEFTNGINRFTKRHGFKK
jgi:hypothetical protein